MISNWVRERVIERLGLATRAGARDPSRCRSRAVPARPLRRRASRFLLYPARPWPHKNHARLFDAFAVLRQRHPELRLVLTGSGHEGRPLPPGVEALGDVPIASRVDLYRRAALMVFPSLYEGFGLPPVEAMACACPVASSSAGSLPEVCGDAARLFDPDSIGRHRRRRRRGSRLTGRLGSARPRPRGDVHLGGDGPRPRRGLPRARLTREVVELRVDQQTRRAPRSRATAPTRAARATRELSPTRSWSSAEPRWSAGSLRT